MLELRNVCKTFHAGTPDEKRALIDVSLQVADGDFISIIGANGAGKSTLFNAICGSFFVDSGSILLEKRNNDAGAPARPGDRAAVPGPDARQRPGYEH